MTVRGMLCDLDGVVYRAHEPCPGAVEGLAAARSAGVRVLFMTNNASRTPDDVAGQLTDLGVPARPEDVLTAAQVAAARIAQDHPQLTGTGKGWVLAVGGPGLGVALDEQGIRWADATRVRESSAGQPLRVDVVVQGYGADIGVLDLTEAAYAVGAGATWVATNDDATLPTERGLAPGNGSLVAAVRHATGRRPHVCGKPHAPAYEEALARLDLPLEDCLMVGDRLDTDIAGARTLGLRSALVLTGVSTAEEARSAPHDRQPDLVVSSLTELEHLWTAAP